MAEETFVFNNNSKYYFIIRYEGNDVYLDQGDGDGANYSVSCKKFDT